MHPCSSFFHARAAVTRAFAVNRNSSDVTPRNGNVAKSVRHRSIHRLRPAMPSLPPNTSRCIGRPQVLPQVRAIVVRALGRTAETRGRRVRAYRYTRHNFDGRSCACTWQRSFFHAETRPWFRVGYREVTDRGCASPRGVISKPRRFVYTLSPRIVYPTFAKTFFS